MRGQGNGGNRLMLSLVGEPRTIHSGGYWSMVRVGLPRYLVVLACLGALLMQTAVSSGALQSCRCACTIRGPHSASESAQPCPCCAKDRSPAPHCDACVESETKSSCCSRGTSDNAPCRCWSHRHETQVAEPSRDRHDRQELSWCGWIDLSSAPFIDLVRPLVLRTAFRPPGVRLHSLLCVWLI